MGLQLHETMYGKNFFEQQLPQLTEAIEKLTESLHAKQCDETAEKSKLSQANREALKSIQLSAKKSDLFGREIIEQIQTDDESMEKIGRYAVQAILDGSINDLLIAICGWSVESLIERVNARLEGK